MLISPIMGPIMAFTFGLIIRDWGLVKMALKTELAGLFTCLISGFLFGFIFSESWGATKWPTPEMASKGMMSSLYSGALVAHLSGSGVAMSVVGGNGASLVGVAISASLLLPTVNCGLLWGLSAIKTVRSMYQTTYVVYDIYNNTAKPALLPPDTYTPTYFPLMDKEFAMLGAISFLLTIVNIICIVISALIILKAKEVVSITTSLSRFWKHDVKVARNYNKSLGENKGGNLGKQILEEWANLNGIHPNTLKNDSEEGRRTQLQTLMDIVEDAEDDDVFRTISMDVPARAADKVNRRLNIVPGMGLQESAPALRGQNFTQGGMLKSNQLKKCWQSKPPSPMDAGHEDDNEDTGGQISKKSVIYNQSPQNPENPYSMRPSGSRIQEMSRFNVSQLPSVQGGGTRTRERSYFPGEQQRGQGSSIPHTSLQMSESSDGKTGSTAF